MECGGCDTAFGSRTTSKRQSPILESIDVQKRCRADLPPHSKTQARNTKFINACEKFESGLSVWGRGD